MNRLFSSAPAFSLLFAALLLAGCATRTPLDMSSVPATPSAFKEQASSAAAATPASGEAVGQGAWWSVFADPVLNQLVEQASRSNNSVQVAAARLLQARAIARQTDAGRAPQVGLGAGATRQTNASTGHVPATVVSAGASLSYEVDLFGKLAGASNAASLDAASREALLRSTRLLVQADVAQTYLSLRALDAERGLVNSTLQAYRNTLRLTEVRFREGDVAELDVARVRSEVASTESDALALERRRAELEHAVAVLIGEVASTFQIAPVEWATALPVIPAGVPSSVLVRRPDIAAAQTTLQAAQARVGVAKTAWFPSISLTATGGYAAPEVGDLFKLSARAWGIGALLSLPIFDGGQREAGVQSANAELDIALANYREQVLVAFRDVEDQLSALRLLADQSEAQSRSVASSSRATLLSDTRYRNGFVSQLELLDAQRSELRNRRQALQVKAAQYLSTVGLIRALGGGWA
ncbi:efflux transporter outer membrane subunit [Polaromonas naphthalenivorans]|uniref:RND efflux system, outer membrane lipoprotein, NodT family n=1 Tax=Polaromonas naphthalenivorans (strain CJ2) TaxID=365044 RepID=A1VLT7_POLNA|nr:efflux transporter outer membrane subunit [Polaromonas naphthalenivorans]ABM36615.1 RND efflux system, outer membrane lipoprotein, NodT family [Polaromonas naphthalenivorans CJ2]